MDFVKCLDDVLPKSVLTPEQFVRLELAKVLIASQGVWHEDTETFAKSLNAMVAAVITGSVKE